MQGCRAAGILCRHRALPCHQAPNNQDQLARRIGALTCAAMLASGPDAPVSGATLGSCSVVSPVLPAYARTRPPGCE
jgi:hypothetical protein